MNRLLQVALLALLPCIVHTSLQAQASEPANPFKDLKAAAEALQVQKNESKAISAPVTLPPPPPAPTTVDFADVGRLAQVQVLAVIGSSALLAQAQGAGTSTTSSPSSFEVHDMRPALVGGLWVVPVVRDGQVRLFKHESLRVVKGVASLAPDAIPVFDWRGGLPNLGPNSAGDEAPRVVGPEALSPSKRNIRL